MKRVVGQNSPRPQQEEQHRISILRVSSPLLAGPVDSRRGEDQAVARRRPLSREPLQNMDFISPGDQ